MASPIQANAMPSGDEAAQPGPNDEVYNVTLEHWFMGYQGPNWRHWYDTRTPTHHHWTCVWAPRVDAGPQAVPIASARAPARDPAVAASKDPAMATGIAFAMAPALAPAMAMQPARPPPLPAGPVIMTKAPPPKKAAPPWTPPPPVPGQPVDPLAVAKAYAEHTLQEYLDLAALADAQALQEAQALQVALAADIAAVQAQAPISPAPVNTAPGPVPMDPVLANPHEWPEEYREMFLDSLPSGTTQDHIAAICSECGVHLQRVFMYESQRKGLLGAELLMSNPAWNLRTLVAEIHGHLSMA